MPPAALGPPAVPSTVVVTLIKLVDERLTAPPAVIVEVPDTWATAALPTCEVARAASRETIPEDSAPTFAVTAVVAVDAIVTMPAARDLRVAGNADFGAR